MAEMDQSLKTSLRWAAVLAVIHVVLALLYAQSTPFMTPGVLMNQRNDEGPVKIIDVGAPDELQHVVYVRRIAAGEGFPTLDPKDPDLGRNYQSHQPPAYYILAAGWSKVFGDSAIGMRSMNAVLGGLTVVGVFLLGWATTRKGAVAVGAAAFAALLPMQVALSGAVSNDPLLFCLCTWSLALAAHYLRDGLCIKRAVLLGTVIGLACLTKTTAIALFPALLVGLLATRERPAVPRVAVCVGVALALGALWWVRNQQLYGDPLAMGVFAAAFQGSPKAEIFIAGFGAPTYWLDWVGWWTMRSFVGVFGYMDIFLPDNLYRIVFSFLAILGLLGVLTLKKEDDKEARAPHLMSLAFFVVIGLLFIMFNKTYFQGQARYLLPAIGPLGVAVGLGVAGLGNARPLATVAGFAVLMLGLNGYIISKLPTEFALRTNQTNSASEASN